MLSRLFFDFTRCIRSGACKGPKVTREVNIARSPPDDFMSRPDTHDTVDDACNTAYQELGQHLTTTS